MATPFIPDADPGPSHKRKIKISARVTDNADPLLPKNKKARAEGHTKAMGKGKAVLKPLPKTGKAQRRPSVEVEDVPEEASLPASLHPKDPNCIIEPAGVVAMDVDGDDSDTVEISDTEPELEAAEESCEAELSK
jgi:hypothetical protein